VYIFTARGCRYLPWVEFVNDALEPYDGKQPGGEPGHPCQEEDGECDEAFPSGRVGEQRLHINIRVRGIEVNSWIAIVHSNKFNVP